MSETKPVCRTHSERERDVHIELEQTRAPRDKKRVLSVSLVGLARSCRFVLLHASVLARSDDKEQQWISMRKKDSIISLSFSRSRPLSLSRSVLLFQHPFYS